MAKPKAKESEMSSSDTDCDGMSELPEKDYDVLRVATPKFRFKASSHPCGGTGMLDFFPFYGGIARGEERILCIDSNGMAALYNADAGTIQMMLRLEEPKRWEPISFFVTHADDPGVLYVMDGAGCSFEALVYGVEAAREGSKLRMVKHNSKRLDHDSYSVF